MKQKEVGFRRLVRMKRVAIHAAELLEKEATGIMECHTLDGDWGRHKGAKADYEDMIQTARQLRSLLG
jgi:hypothetical protein